MKDLSKLKDERNILGCFGSWCWRLFSLPSVKQRQSERLYHENDSYPVDFWNEYFQAVQLTDIMRQKEDLSLACCLNSICTRTLKGDLGVEVIQMHIN